jgi:hypothetical protein
MFLGTLITTNAILIFTAKKIEQYTQEAVVEFYQGLQGKDIYVATLGYKSFAQYFYSNEQSWKDSNATNNLWLLDGNIDKPAYFSCKITKLAEYQNKRPHLKELYRKNGFVFLVRNPIKQ